MNDRKIGTKRVNRTKGKATAVAQADVSQRTDADEASATLRRIWHHYRQATQGFWQRAADPEPGTLEERRSLLAEIRRAVLGDAEVARMHGTRLATKVRDIIALSEAHSYDPKDPDSDVACHLSTPYLVLHRMVLTAVQRVREEDPGEWIGESEVYEHGLLVLIAADREFDPGRVGFPDCPPWVSGAAPAMAIMNDRSALLGPDPAWPGFWRMARYVRNLFLECAVQYVGGRTGASASEGLHLASSVPEAGTSIYSQAVAQAGGDTPMPTVIHVAVLRYMKKAVVAVGRSKIADALWKEFGKNPVHDAIADLHRWEFVKAPPGSKKPVGLLDKGRRWIDEYDKVEGVKR